MLTQEYVRSRFDYIPETGDLVWKPKEVTRPQDKTFNARWAGKIAGDSLNGRYWRVRIAGKEVLAHHLVWLYHKGYLPKMIDHKDQDKTNNRIENLRETTKSQNGFNRKTKGCYWYPRDKKWRVKLMVNGKQIHIGYFDTQEKAETAYREAANHYHGEFACY